MLEFYYEITNMKKKVYYIILALAILLSVFFAFEILNMMVSLKYETNYPTDCISKINGEDICAGIKLCKYLTLVFGLITIVLIVFRNKFKK